MTVGTLPERERVSSGVTVCRQIDRDWLGFAGGTNLAQLPLDISCWGRKFMRKILIPLAMAASAAAALPAAAQTVYNYGTDFGNAAFSYGYGTVGSTFTPFSNSYPSGCFNGATLACRTSAGSGVLPGVGINTSPVPVTFYTNTLSAGTLFIQSGPDSGQDAIVRFTAQFTGTYTVSALFNRVDTTANGDGVNLSAYFNNHLDDTYYLANIVGNSALYTDTRVLQAGDVFAFGVNRNAEYTFDGTGITGTITGVAVPEPATWAMMVVGFGLVGFALRSRRKTSVRVTYA